MNERQFALNGRNVKKEKKRKRFEYYGKKTSSEHNNRGTTSYDVRNPGPGLGKT